LFALLLFQTVPWPTGLVRLLSPRTAALRQAFVPASAGSGWTTFSLLPGRTLAAGLELSAYVLIAYLVLRTVRHRSQIRRFMAVLVASGVFQALYGLFETTQKVPRLLFYQKLYGLEAATGTFVNRNHFAGYLELVLPIALGLLLSRLELFDAPGRTWRERLGRLTGRGAAGNVLFLAAFAVMALALLRSNSRTGAAVLVFTFVLVSVLAAVHFGRTRFQRARVRSFLKVAAAAVIVLALYAGVESMIDRFAADGLLRDGRPRYWGMTLRMIGDFPVFGVGLGGFGEVFRAYDTLGLEYDLVHAHNDYLEFLADLGIVGFGLLAVGLGILLTSAFRTWAGRRSPELKGLALGGLASIAAILVHGLTDFNFHIPANVLAFTVVLSLTLATVYHRKA
jgi:O-antigen ligase